MSSGTSTSAADDGQLPPDNSSLQRTQGLQPWQLFLLAALACATVGMYLTNAQGISGVVLLSVLIGAAALVGLATLLAVKPLVDDSEDRTRVIGQRTRDALEREKSLALRALKELEFDRAMGKLADGDFQEISTRLRARAARLMRQLDAGDGYRARIEHEIASRLVQTQSPEASKSAGSRPATRTCAACATANDADARFCKGCGVQL
ncbi:MAG: hypothetical protein AB7F99_02255 [Vicinamibacterales bacterium]